MSMKIVTNENKLRVPCKPINKETNLHKLNKHISDAVDIMLKNNGCGIAANQVGIDKQFFVAIIDNERIQVFINPVILSHSKETNEECEGCLSFPNRHGTVTRYNEVIIRYFNGKSTVTETFTGFNARVIQHEYDHLQGVCYVDKAKDIIIEGQMKTA